MKIEKVFEIYKTKYDEDHMEPSILILLNNIIHKINHLMNDYPVTTHYCDELFKLEIEQAFIIYGYLIKFETAIDNDCEFDVAYEKLVSDLEQI